MADKATLGTSAIAMTLAANESIWVIGESVIGADAEVKQVQTMSPPGWSGINPFAKANLGLYKNEGQDPALLLLGGPMNSCLMVIDAEQGGIVVRASSFVAANEGGTAQSHDPIFSGHPDYEPMDWTHCKSYTCLIISGRGALFRVAVDGEHLVDVDTIVAYSSNLTITPIASDGTTAAKRLADIHQPIYRFTGCGSLWCQAGRTRAFGRLLRPHLNKKVL